MNRDSSHADFMDRWISYMRTHQNWRVKHAQFINAQYVHARKIIRELAKTPEGKEKIRKMYNITNKNAYKTLLG